MATNPASYCTLTTLQATQGCYTCLSPSERANAKLYYMVQLATALGLDVPSIAAGLSEATCFACEPDTVLEAFELAIWKRAAVAAGADIANQTAAELNEAIKCYKCVSPKLIKAGTLIALCEILNELSKSEVT